MAREMTHVHAAIAAASDRWRRDRRERQARRHLDPADFAELRSAGFLETVVPIDQGGLWVDPRRSTRPVAEMLRTLAGGDASVALVASMHPAVVGFWLVNDDASPGWQEQRRAVFDTALAGEQWGTITSEPGSGGDITRTRSAATPAPDVEPCIVGDAYRITGDKHFGSGSGVTSFMITSGLPAGSDEPAMFVLDVRGRPWNGAGGMAITAEWDGMGMEATQSHAMRLQDMPAVRLAWPRPLEELTLAASPLISTLFTAVVLGVLDEAVGLARSQVADRAGTLRPYEQVEWTRAEMDHWLAVQAYEGALRAVESGVADTALHATQRAKQAVAGLAEAALLRLTRVLGGGTFSRRSPYSHWFEDVRALGFLRPPWGLAFDGLFATSLGGVDGA
ncbi:MAG: hypothetical protein M5U14_05270 [Acidimicrobiia bacterium]|nr:hypothetical protein [Acidimicrobiia bacterium]